MRVKHFSAVIAAALCSLFTSSVFAEDPPEPAEPEPAEPEPAEPKPAEFCADDDGDGYYTASTGCVPPHGKKAGDCNDENTAIHPKATEVRDNGIDEDCEDDDLKTPEWLKKNLSNKALKILLKEVEVCEAAMDSDENQVCIFNKVTLKPKVVDGYNWLDLDCDGVRGVVGDDHSQTIAEKRACAKATARKSRKSAVGLPSGATPTTIPGSATPTTAPAPKGSPVAIAIANVQTQAATASKDAAEAKTVATAANAKADAASKDAADAKVLVDGHEKKIQKNIDDLGVLDTALKAETSAREADVKRLEGEIDQVDKKVIATSKDVGSLLKLGPLAEFYIGGGTLAQRPGGHSGNVVRGLWSPGVHFGANLGAETADGRWNAFGVLERTGEESGAAKDRVRGLAWQVGGEYAKRFGNSSTFLGPHVLYQQHEAGGNVVSSNVVSRGVGVGATFATTTPGGPGKFGLLGRLTFGYESSAADAGLVTKVEDGPFVSVSLGVTFGVGAKRTQTKVTAAAPPPTTPAPPAPESDPAEEEASDGDTTDE
jgi:hypothetical protein